MKIGDTVAIRGDLRKQYSGQCEYTEEQLVDGKYVRNTKTGGIWLGKITKIAVSGDLVRLDGRRNWYGIPSLEVIF